MAVAHAALVVCATVHALSLSLSQLVRKFELSGQIDKLNQAIKEQDKKIEKAAKVEDKYLQALNKQQAYAQKQGEIADGIVQVCLGTRLALSEPCVAGYWLRLPSIVLAAP
eukprot:6179539-Pleurochrysis_carterae.AAC.4